jgi:hypothetical protein
VLSKAASLIYSMAPFYIYLTKYLWQKQIGNPTPHPLASCGNFTEVFSKRRKIYSICVEGNERNRRNKQPNFRSSFSLGSNLTTFAFFAVFAVSKLDTHCIASNYNIQPYMPCLQTSDLHSA